jgi:hypothetical protein
VVIADLPIQPESQSSFVNQKQKLGRLVASVVLQGLSFDLGVLLILDVINVSDDSIISVENSGDLLQSRSLGLNVEKVDKDKLDQNPALDD